MIVKVGIKIFAENIRNEKIKKYFVSSKSSKCENMNKCQKLCYENELVKLMSGLIKLIDKKSFFIYQLPYYKYEKIEWLKDLKSLLKCKEKDFRETFTDDIADEYLELVEYHLETLNRIPDMNLREKQDFVLSALYGTKEVNSMSEIPNKNVNEDNGDSVSVILNGDSEAHTVSELLEQSGYIEYPYAMGMGDTIFITAQGKLYVEEYKNRPKTQQVIKDISELEVLLPKIAVMIDNSVTINGNGNQNNSNIKDSNISQKIIQAQTEITQENFKEYLDSFLQDLNVNIEGLNLPKDDKDDIENEVKRIETQISRETPKYPIITSSLEMIKDLITGITVNAMSPNVIDKLTLLILQAKTLFGV